MLERRRILVLPVEAPGDLEALGELLAGLRRERGWKIDEVIAKMAESKQSGGDPNPDLPHPGSLRAVEAASRAPSKELAASWFAAFDWKVDPSDPPSSDELVVTQPGDEASIRLVFGLAARTSLLLDSSLAALAERRTVEETFPVGSGKTTATLCALEQLHRRSQGDVRAVWIVFHRALARQVLDRARRMGISAAKGGGVISLKKAASNRTARDWSVAVGTYWDARELIGSGAWDSAIPSEGTLLIVDETHHLAQEGGIASMTETLASRVQGTILFSSTPYEPPNFSPLLGVQVPVDKGPEPKVVTRWGTDPKDGEGLAIAQQAGEMNRLNAPLHLEKLDRDDLVKVATYMAEMLSPTERLLAKGYLDALSPDTE